MRSTENVIQRLDAFIERIYPTLNAPGIAVGLTNRECLLHAGVYGLANQEAGQNVTLETLFQIGSISKSFTSIALLQLQEQGLLNINDPVTKYLPWFEIQSEYEPITLRHLMSHTAGIIIGNDDTVSAHTEVWNLRYTKATAPPGELFHYSNSGYKVLGLVLETLLKQEISYILHERILAPLGMDATVPVICSDIRPKLAVGYNPLFDDRPLLPGGPLAPATWLESNTADGSICSTTEDMCLYIQALLQQGTKLLTPKSFKQIIQPIISTDSDVCDEHYGLGLSTYKIDGHLVIGHSGGMVGYTADMLADLDAGLGVIVLTNGPAETAKISRYAMVLLRAAWEGGELPDLPEAEIPEVDDLAGTYRCAENIFTLTVKEGCVYLDFESVTVPLHKLGPDRFLVPHPAFELFPLRIGRENAQVVEAIHGGERYVRDGGKDGTPFESPVEWDAYPGHYRSHNPWLSNFRVVLRKGMLVFIEPSGEEESLHQIKPGLFRVGDEPRSPEFIQFEIVIDGKARQANLSGAVYSRAFTP